MFANGRTNAEREAHDWFRRSLEANRNHTLSHFQFAGAAGLDGIVSWGALNRKVERGQAQAEERIKDTPNCDCHGICFVALSINDNTHNETVNASSVQRSTTCLLFFANVHREDFDGDI